MHRMEPGSRVQFLKKYMKVVKHMNEIELLTDRVKVFILRYTNGGLNILLKLPPLDNGLSSNIVIIKLHLKWITLNRSG